MPTPATAPAATAGADTPPDPAAERHAAARLSLACLDLTSLNDADTADTVDALAARAGGPAGRPAALCVWPHLAARAKARAPVGVAVAAVANFPAGDDDPERALADTRAIVAAGADEVDLVLPWRTLAAGDAERAAALVRAVRGACAGRVLKLILESGELSRPELIVQASRIGLAEGVDFLKTSTGKTPHGASLAAAELMLQAIADDAPQRARQRRDQQPAGFKASGGIRSVDGAMAYLALARRIGGAGADTPQRLRFGASGLLDDIEAVLGVRPGGAGAPEGGY